MESFLTFFLNAMLLFVCFRVIKGNMDYSCKCDREKRIAEREHTKPCGQPVSISAGKWIVKKNQSRKSDLKSR